MRTHCPIPLALVAASAFALARPAPATIRLVKPDGTGDFPTIAAAVAAAADHDFIGLTDGVFSGEGNYNVSISGKTVFIASMSGDAAGCVIDPGGVTGESRRAFIFASIGPSALAHVTGLTIRNARADGVGQAGDGGAILIDHAYLELENCVFEENAARRGGAVFVGESSTARITGCRFAGNQADESGGAVMFGLATSMGVIHICTFTGNTAPEGGAIACLGTGNPLIWSSTFHANSAGASGGAHLYLRGDARPMLVRCILAAGLQGGAVARESGTEIPSISCTDIWGNADGDWTECIAELARTGGNLHANPRFCDAGAGDFRLESLSPCATGTGGCATIGAWEIGCATSLRVCCAGPVCCMLEESECLALGGAFITDPLFPICETGICDMDAQATTWGSLKRMFIEPDHPW
jgi:predicted outer membrane repeat protein